MAVPGHRKLLTAPPLDVVGVPGFDAGNIVGQKKMPPRDGGHITNTR